MKFQVEKKIIIVYEKHVDNVILIAVLCLSFSGALTRYLKFLSEQPKQRNSHDKCMHSIELTLQYKILKLKQDCGPSRI